MSPGDGKAIALERVGAVSPSPARKALRSNLSLADGDGHQTLRKKKSWMASLRDVVQKGALQAKYAVDLFRVDAHKDEPEAEQTPSKIIVHKRSEPDLPRRSTDSSSRNVEDKSTPDRPHADRYRSFTSRFASMSLRHERKQSTAYDKRSSVYSVSTRPSVDGGHSMDGPETFMTPPQHGNRHCSHKKRDSVTGSLIGSIRGMGHRRRSTAPGGDFSTTEPASPTSPINIPIAAPQPLKLDLGPLGFRMSPPGSMLADRTKVVYGPEALPEIPSSKTEWPKQDSKPRSTFGGRLNLDDLSHLKPVAPKDLLQVDIDDQMPFFEADRQLPATPMPGTTFTLEVECTSSETSPVFERSVTPPDEREQKQLRAMQSLDAMAEACRAAHLDHEIGAAVDGTGDFQERATLVSDDGQASVPNLGLSMPRRVITSDTVYTLPTDMSELCRQHAHTDSMSTATHVGKEPLEDPFADSNTTTSGPPSPDRSVKLPLRPKIQDYSMDSVARRTPSHHSEEIHPAEPLYVDEADDMPVTYEFKVSSSPTSSLREQMDMQRCYDLAERPAEAEEHETDRHKRERSGTSDPFGTPASDDDTHDRAEGLRAAGVLLPWSEDGQSFTEEGMSPHSGPVYVEHQTDVSLVTPGSDESPRKRRTYAAGLGEAQYQFSFENWLRESSSAASPGDQPVTPNRRRLDVSLNTVSTNEERKTPQISPATTNPDRTPSMGNRLEFELKRSERNMRYNALQQETTESWETATAGLSDEELRFLLGHAAEDGSNLNVESDDTKVLPTRVGSDESVAESLKDAVHDYSQLECQLDKSADTSADSTATMKDPFSSPESAMPAPLYVSHRSPSPSPEALSSDRTSRHYNPSMTNNRFALLSSSSANSPSTVIGGLPHPGYRVASPDTLDDSLAMFSSPDSGYQADNSSIGRHDSGKEKLTPARYRSVIKKKGGQPGRDISKNF